MQQNMVTRSRQFVCDALFLCPKQTLLYYKCLGINVNPRAKICTARCAGGTDFGVLYLIVPSYLYVFKRFLRIRAYASSRCSEGFARATSTQNPVNSLALRKFQKSKNLLVDSDRTNLVNGQNHPHQ
jgi:hypothetical protein